MHACVPQVEPRCCCDYCGDQKHHPPRHICHHPFPEGVGRRGRMKGGREWEKEEGEGRRKSRRTDDGKMATPVGPYARCFESATLCRSLQMLTCSIPFFSSLVSHITRVSSSAFLNVSLSVFNFLTFLHLTWKTPSLLHSHRLSELSDHHKTPVWALPSGWALWFSGVFDLLCSHLSAGRGLTVWAGNLSELGDRALSAVNDIPYPSMHVQTIIPFTAHTFLFSSTSESPPVPSALPAQHSPSDPFWTCGRMECTHRGLVPGAS